MLVAGKTGREKWPIRTESQGLALATRRYNEEISEDLNDASVKKIVEKTRGR